MDRKFALVAILFAILVVAGYLYYPYVVEPGKLGEVPPGMKGRFEALPPATVRTTATTRAMTKAGEYGGTTYIPYNLAGMIRKVSVTVTISLEVDDVRRAASKVEELAYSLGGYVQHSSITGERGYLTIKVPKADLETALSRIRSLGDVKREEMNTVDLTDAIVDLDARLRNARAEEKRLLDLMSKAENVRDLLEIEERLSAVRERIERLQAVKERMERRVDYATINIDLRRRGVSAHGESFFDKILRDAERALLGSIYILVVGAAFLVVPTILAVLVWVTYRRLAAERPGG